MGITKTAAFTARHNSIANAARALAHPARIAIIEYLLNRESCVCGELVQEINLAQPTISQHLKALKTAGIIQGTISGTSTCYCINPDNWKELQSLLNSFFNTTVKPENNCC